MTNRLCDTDCLVGGLSGCPAHPTMLSPKQLGTRWGVKARTIIDRINAEEVPARKLGKHWLIPLQWVEAFEDEIVSGAPNGGL